MAQAVLNNWDMPMVFNCVSTPKFNPAELLVSHIKAETRVQYYIEEFDLL